MKVAYVVTGLDATETTGETTASIKKNDENAEVFVCLYSETKTEAEAVNEWCDKIEQISKDITHICIIPDGSTLSEKWLSIMTAYARDEKAIYMPVGGYYYDPENDNQFKGFLNTIMWKPQVAEVVGELTTKLATRQIDHTLYGALIPLYVMKDYKFNKDIKYFSHFEFVNKVLKGDVEIIGVPKVLYNLYKDYELKAVDKEEKMKYFEEARNGYLPMVDLPPELLKLQGK